jgi:hypothetical protein
MTKASLDGNTLVLPLEPFLARINRRLHKLIPYRELFYDFGQRQYYVRIINATGSDHLSTQGPYYYHHMIGLARHIELFNGLERSATLVQLKSRKGQVYDEVRLPGHLKFDVLTPILKDALAILQAKGWTVASPRPSAIDDIPNEPVTADASVTVSVTEY